MNQKTQNPEPAGPRTRLVRQTAVLQVKLLADGLRDAALIPVSLFAALIGLIRGGEEADREFRQVIKLGRHSERWINLFGHHLPLIRSHPAGSLDKLIDRVETVVREQVRKGAATPEAEAAIEEALEDLHQATDEPSKSIHK
jgi:hypothetical protein